MNNQKKSNQSSINALISHLFAPVSNASLITFRIGFGALMLWEIYRYFSAGWVRKYWVEPVFFFKYYGFGWVHPWQHWGIEDGMYFHFIALGIFAFCIMIGYWYRISMTLFALGFTYVFLLDQAHYLNHFYLIILISFLMIFISAHHAFSIDAWRRPSIRAMTATRWQLWLLRAQLAIVYVYGGISKLNADWLQGEPMRMWMARVTDYPMLGQFFTEEWMVYVFSYGGLIFDLLIVPAVLWRRTRWLAVAAMLFFHLSNAYIFSIGVFPWFMLAATVLFLPPHWFRVESGKWKVESEELVVDSGALKVDSGALKVDSGTLEMVWQRVALVAVIGVYLVYQLVMPFRHFLNPGIVHWTEEGHRFSWHMLVRSKDGNIEFEVKDMNGALIERLHPMAHLTGRQAHKMATRPDMIWQYANYLAKVYPAENGLGDQQVQVFADAEARLNQHPWQDFIDPTVDLATQPRTLRRAWWIVPLAVGE